MHNGPSPTVPGDFWNLTAGEVLTSLSTTANGLSSAEAELRQKQFGLNTLQNKARQSSTALFLYCLSSW
jgi:hypothetical protein